jgi:hypothetical protein
MWLGACLLANLLKEATAAAHVADTASETVAGELAAVKKELAAAERMIHHGNVALGQVDAVREELKAADAAVVRLEASAAKQEEDANALATASGDNKLSSPHNSQRPHPKYGKQRTSSNFCCCCCAVRIKACLFALTASFWARLNSTEEEAMLDRMGDDTSEEEDGEPPAPTAAAAAAAVTATATAAQGDGLSAEANYARVEGSSEMDVEDTQSGCDSDDFDDLVDDLTDEEDP